MTLQIEGMRGAGSAQKRTINEMEERGREREKALAADVAALQAEASQRDAPLPSHSDSFPRARMIFLSTADHQTS